MSPTMFGEAGESDESVKGGNDSLTQELFNMFKSVMDNNRVSSKASSKSKEKSKTTSKEKSKPTSKSVSKEKSKAVSKSEENEPKVTSKIKKRKGKKITEINIKLDKVKGVSKSLKTSKKDEKMAEMVSEGMKLDKVSDNKQEVKLEESKNKLKLESVEKDSQHVGLTAGRVLNMVENAVHTHQGLSNDEKHPSAGKPNDRKTPSALSASKERPVMEMMKVKKAEDDSKKKAEVDPKKKAELENELLKDYPVDGSVEITNWQGTFAPIAGEPYVAPVQHQPDSFWDAIYRSTSPDLPTPPGGGYTGDSEVTPAPDSVEPTVHQTLGRFAQPKQEVYHTEYERTKYVEGKTKDKAKKEPKKPKLSPKEKKQKKREKKEKKEGKIGQGDIKVNAYHDGDQKMISADAHQRLQDEILMHPNINPVASVNQPSPHNAHGHGVIHAAGKSEETLKTPSEEERESGTTYRPEGNYEYPSFRHPDFNPDTAYDEHGIPIHESPGWTPPPTLPGDNRFGKDRSRAAVPRDQAHGSLTLARPQTADNHVVANKAVKPLADPHVAQPVHPDPHLQHALHPNIAAQEAMKAVKPVTDPHVAQPLHPDPHLQHALHPNMAAHEANKAVNSLAASHLAQPLHPEPHLQHPLHPNVAAHEANKAVKPLTASHVAQPLHPEQHFQQALHANLAAHENLPHPLNLHSNLADQEHQHLAEALHAAHVNPAAAHSEHGDHPGVPHILPALHQGAPIKDGAVNHKIQKRMAEEPGETLDSLSSVMTTQELNTAAERYNQQSKANQYKAYKLTDSELKEKDDSAPLEALNPALYMHRNIFHVKKKPQKNHIPELGGSEEVIALVVGPKNVDPKEALKMIGLNKFHKVRKVQPKKPVVYTKKNEAQNPLLYKHRNMLKVSDIKDDEMKIHKNMAKQMALQELQKKVQTKVIPLEDILGAHGFKGRGRENFNTIFVNRHKLFQVNTNKFKKTSMEHIVAKREVKESLNPILYSYQNLFGSNPKQILPLKNEKMKETPDQGASSPVSRFAMVQGQNTIDLAKIKGPMFGGGVPIIDQDSIEKPLDPKVKQYVGRKKEAMNPYLMNFPNMFAINPKAPPKQQGMKDKPNTALDPSVKQYMGRNKENLNPFLYGYTNMFGVSNNGPDKVQLQAGDINPLLYAKQKPYSAVEKESVMSKYRNLFANPAPRLNSANDQQANDNSRINERARPRRHIAEMGHNLLETFDRQKREIKDQHSKEAVRPRPQIPKFPQPPPGVGQYYPTEPPYTWGREGVHHRRG